MKKFQYDYLIAGAGVSGLTAAIILAKAGMKVVIIEQSKAIAPTLRGFIRKGFYFDTGVHYVGAMQEGEALYNCFKYLGINKDINAVLMDEKYYEVAKKRLDI